MNSDRELPPLIVVVGPTGSGKSVLGVSLAARFGGEVIACDSTQLYRGFDIGTAKPSLPERKQIPHHLMDLLEPDQNATAGTYRQLALAVLADLKTRARVPVLTVGTGLYLRALLEGLAELPGRSERVRDRLRASAREHFPGHLHRLLGRLDPEMAGKIAPADEQKLIRAVEVCLLAKRPVSELQRAGRVPLEGWRIVKLGLAPPREQLYRRIEARTDSMLERGWLAEVRTLLERGAPEDAKPFDFIGYRELRKVARREATLENARAAILLSTRQYAKRQLTWFRRETGVHWLEGFGDDPGLLAAASERIFPSGALVRPDPPGSV